VHTKTNPGSLIGHPDTMREMLAFAQDNHITPMIEQMTISRVNQAIHRVKGNKARYRIVLANMS
jgi:D-arabinose 1-dehydrogenase-like Zn-dependent alcohol dehydrogenase